MNEFSSEMEETLTPVFSQAWWDGKCASSQSSGYFLVAGESCQGKLPAFSFKGAASRAVPKSAEVAIGY